MPVGVSGRALVGERLASPGDEVLDCVPPGAPASSLPAALRSPSTPRPARGTPHPDGPRTLRTMDRVAHRPTAVNASEGRLPPATTAVSSAPTVSNMPAGPAACPYVVGDDGLASWSDTHADAWIGRAARGGRAQPQPGFAHHRPARSPRTRQAPAVRRGRSRGRSAHHRRGLQLTREAQATHFASVQERFFDRLQPGELDVLAAVFGRLSPRAAAACTAEPARA